MNILGINAWHADAAAVLVRDGELVAAVEEERCRRVKHCAGFPREAIRACLAIGGVDGRAIDHVAVSRRPWAHAGRKAWHALRRQAGRGLLQGRAANYRAIAGIPDAAAEALDLRPGDPRPRTHWVEHHAAHLASAFDVSPFDEAAVCALDGFGDFVSASAGVGRGADLRITRRTFFPHSLGLLYLAVTQHLGFWRFGDECKVMGLAPFGRPDFADRLRGLVHLTSDGRFALNLPYFRHASDGAAMTWDAGEPSIGRVFSERLEALIGPARRPDEPLAARHEAIAASVQLVFEEAVFHVLNALHARTRLPRLCLAGGCALNSVANGRIRERTPFTDVYIQPAAADNGTALGAAFHVWHRVLGGPRRFVMRHGFWGPAVDGGDVARDLEARSDDLRRLGCTIRRFDDAEALCGWTAARLADGLVVGWVQGRMEWGARALGNRSILADPRRAGMRDVINATIKSRERFQPCAPSILDSARGDWFHDAAPDPFMVQVRPIRAERRADLAAVTHVDGSGRLQTVSRDDNPRYWQLLTAFERLTGVPALLNTSFNEQEPIVQRPAEALDCFLRTGLDVLVLGDVAIVKASAREAVHAVA